MRLVTIDDGLVGRVVNDRLIEPQIFSGPYRRAGIASAVPCEASSNAGTNYGRLSRPQPRPSAGWAQPGCARPFLTRARSLLLR